jgi:3-oxoacyl-[acyl-carrier-protein] synthase II
LDRLALFAVAACCRTLDDAQLEVDAPAGDRIGVIVGTGHRPSRKPRDVQQPGAGTWSRSSQPAVFPNTVHNAAAGQVATLLATRGPTSTVTAAHAAGAAALAIAEDMLRSGHADALLCAAVDALSAAALQVYAEIPLFGSPAARRYVLSEGGIALVLERRSAARARAARILGLLAGHGIASDAAGIGRWDMRGAGVERAMRTALDAAGLEPVNSRRSGRTPPACQPWTGPNTPPSDGCSTAPGSRFTGRNSCWANRSGRARSSPPRSPSSNGTTASTSAGCLSTAPRSAAPTSP